MIEGVDYFVRRVDFPNRANPALVCVNDDGTFDIYLNTLYDDERLAEELQHEIRHIKDEHFYVDLPTDRIERQADGEPLDMAFHPPEGHIAHFASEAALAHYIETLSKQRHVDLSRCRWQDAIRPSKHTQRKRKTP